MFTVPPIGEICDDPALRAIADGFAGTLEEALVWVVEKCPESAQISRQTGFDDKRVVVLSVDVKACQRCEFLVFRMRSSLLGAAFEESLSVVGRYKVFIPEKEVLSPDVVVWVAPDIRLLRG